MPTLRQSSGCAHHRAGAWEGQGFAHCITQQLSHAEAKGFRRALATEAGIWQSMANGHLADDLCGASYGVIRLNSTGRPMRFRPQGCC